MKNFHLSLAFLAVTTGLCAQDLARVMPPPLPPQVKLPESPAAKLSGVLDPALVLPAQPHEVQLLAALRGVIFVSDPLETTKPVPAGFAGVEVTGAPLLADADVATAVAPFLGRPASLPSLGRIALVARFLAQMQGHAFVIAYVPAQDLTDSVVRAVIHRAKLEGNVGVEGARYFPKAHYEHALALPAGEEIDAMKLSTAVEALNQNPFRRAVLSASAGHAPGTTRLTLRVNEERPWKFNFGYDNTGTAVTGEDRISAGVTWGNAFGRGDVMSYRFTADPAFAHSLSHSANYNTVLPWKHTLATFGAYSRIESELPAPLTQVGHSWQVGTRYGWTLPKLKNGWAQTLSFGPDFKYSDNNLEFAAIPITNNVTHIAQFGATYALSKRTQKQSLGASVSLYASPGGLSSHNEDEFFDVSRAGATADYFYGRIDLNYSRALPHGFSLSSTLGAQAGSGELLGSEQLNGGGSSAVRGYRESSAFGDGGVVCLNELHFPAFSPSKTGDHLDPFAFFDAATLYTLGLGGEDTQLAGAGVGVNYQWRKYFTVRAAYGWQLKDLGGGENSRAHVSASLNF
ncbi:ShlB/FhaC/HecB family hemolysin secretion/activation protein [Oleiharenicola lentus]|uniref:ShlB/FhaC/HecB family hemolysin secretion/activation protein n=1 Tax=Oleiharenicola lentus TaxID=2508720 RepID=UPI003F66573C